jgi:hypothetical protein
MNFKKIFSKRKDNDVNIIVETTESAESREVLERERKKDSTDSSDEMSDEALEQVAGGYWLRSSSFFL